MCDAVLDINLLRIKAEEEEEDLLDSYATPGKVSHISDLITQQHCPCIDCSDCVCTLL